MARTESLSIQVHPKNEQEQIELMQKFHWSLLSSQELKNIDNHLERRGDQIYQVTSTEHYVKLMFSRELDLPNLTELKKLEQSYYSIPYPKYPKLFPGTIWLWLVLAFIYGIGVIGYIAYFFLSYKPKKEAADKIATEGEMKRRQILSEVENYN